MPVTRAPDVVIVGGGPAGASTAFALARAGVRVTLLDRARFPRAKPCAEYLSPEASRVLDAMGALTRVEQSGAAALSGVVVRAPNGCQIRGAFVAAHPFRGFRDHGLSVRREVLDAILVQCARAAGAEVVEGARVVDVTSDARGRTSGVVVLDGDSGRREIRARLTVGADGLRSVVARRLRLVARSRWPRRLALVSHFRGVRGMSDVAEMHVERDGYVGIADVGHGITTVALVVPGRWAHRVAAGRQHFLSAWIQACPQLRHRFADAERISPVVATGPFASRARRAWNPNALLVGDAADFFDPFTGEGIYSALRGGELAAEQALEALGAASEIGSDEALRAYDERRRAVFGGKWIVERVVAAVVGSPVLINRAARALSRRRDLADLLIGVTGNFVPASSIISMRYLLGAFGVTVGAGGAR